MEFITKNKNSKIGIKTLTKADLGQGNSHQTHIGLYEGVTDYLGNHIIISSYLLCNNKIYICPTFYDMICPKGNKKYARSPKIRTGNNDSSTSKIRELVDSENKWYLLWFGLESDELLFMLIRDESYDCNFLKSIVKGSLNKIKITDDSIAEKIIDYINEKYFKYESECPISLIENEENKKQEILYKASTGVKIKDWSIVRPNRDLKKHAETIAEVGIIGEKKVNEYLSKLKSDGEIKSFTWLNEFGESYNPYDFKVVYSTDDIEYIDVKTTKGNEESPIYFSKQEIDFIADHENNYYVYRVFNVKTSAKLKKSKKVVFASDVRNEISKLESTLKNKNVSLISLNVSSSVALEEKVEQLQ